MDFGRDGCRTPMIWDESKKFAGFSSIKPWLPIKKEQIINSVKKQLKNRDSTYHFYKTFISLRKKISFFTEEIYFENNNEPILKENKNRESEHFDDDETVKKIIDVLDTKIRPAVARDGGDIKFKSFVNGVVKVELQGSCSGCPSSLMTLKQGVQNLLKHYVKEVNSVEAI